MEKKNIETLIKKYHLNGLVDQVRWLVKDKELKVVAMTSDKKLLASVSTKKFDSLDDVEIGIIDSSKLKQMLGAVNEQMTLTPVHNPKDNNRIVSLTISDDHTEMSYMTADLDVLPAPPKFKKIPDFGVEVILTDVFIEKFLKAKLALPEAELYTLAMNPKKQKLELIFGFSKNNSNKIALELPTVLGKDSITEPISFSAKNLKEILSANTELKDPILKVASDGLSYIEFNNTDFQSYYYMIKVDVED